MEGNGAASVRGRTLARLRVLPFVAIVWALAAVILAAVPTPLDDDELPVPGATRRPAKKAINLYAIMPPDRRATDLRRRHADAGSFPALLESVTRGLVGAPYVLSPLGEGALPDADPRFRVDAFDCTTFVETAIALGWEDAWPAAEERLDEVRYFEGDVGFANRRHLIAAQWVPGLRRDRYLEDITAEVGGPDTKTAKLALTEKRWKRRRIAKTLELEQVPFGNHDLPMLSIDAMLERASKIPPGTIINIIRLDVPWSPIRVTHQGLVIVPPGENVRMVRHASPVAKRVVDETLTHMMKRYKKPRKWKVVGVNLQRILPPER